MPEIFDDPLTVRMNSKTDQDEYEKSHEDWHMKRFSNVFSFQNPKSAAQRIFWGLFF